MSYVTKIYYLCAIKFSLLCCFSIRKFKPHNLNYEHPNRKHTTINVLLWIFISRFGFGKERELWTQNATGTSQSETARAVTCTKERGKKEQRKAKLQHQGNEFAKFDWRCHLGYVVLQCVGRCFNGWLEQESLFWRNAQNSIFLWQKKPPSGNLESPKLATLSLPMHRWYRWGAGPCVCRSIRNARSHVRL